MSTYICEANAAIPEAAHALLRVPAGLFAATFIALLLTGCASAPQSLLTSSDPSAPDAPAPRVNYRSTTATYVSQRPVVPAPWRQQNERVAPQPKTDQ